MSALDTSRSSAITDHPFEPRRFYAYLCKVCNMAEAAHAETTVSRDSREES